MGRSREANAVCSLAELDIGHMSEPGDWVWVDLGGDRGSRPDLLVACSLASFEARCDMRLAVQVAQVVHLHRLGSHSSSAAAYLDPLGAFAAPVRAREDALVAGSGSSGSVLQLGKHPLLMVIDPLK